jgi:hypothetical protein
MTSDFDRTMAGFRSAEMISHFMQANLQYASEEQRINSRENGFWWKTPEETFNDSFGFCYDLAAFALYGLRCSGLTDGQLLFVAWGHWGIDSNAGHFVCIHRKGESYYSIDNGVLKGPYSFEQLLLSASRDREILSYRYFTAKEVPYHVRYSDMTNFVDTDTEALKV